jgi:transcriptional regulator with XRE-family HTH domain
MCGEFNRFLPTHNHTGETMIQEANGFNKSIGQKIKDARLKAKLTQTKLAKHCDITFQQVQKYEKGVNGCSAFRLNQISKKLKVPITYFFVDNFNSRVSLEIQQLDKNGKLKPLLLTEEMEVKDDKSSSR